MRIAIVIPAYNCERTIKDTLSSLETQGDALLQLSRIFVMDDCSTDNTVDACKKFWSGRIPLEIIVGEQNKGNYALTNVSLTTLQGDYEWVVILHSDDIVKPHWLSTTLERIRKCGESTASICSSWDTFWEDGRVFPGEDEVSETHRIIAGTVEAAADTVGMGCWWHISGCAIRSAAFKDVGLFDVHLPQTADLDWLIRCLMRGWSIEYVPQTLVRYRQHADTYTSRSMRTCRDLREHLEIYRRYDRVGRRSSSIRLRLLIVRYALRRALRSISRLDLVRFTSSLHVAFDAGSASLSALVYLSRSREI